MGGSVSPGMGVHFQNIGGFTLDRNMHHNRNFLRKCPRYPIMYFQNILEEQIQCILDNTNLLKDTDIQLSSILENNTFDTEKVYPHLQVGINQISLSGGKEMRINFNLNLFCRIEDFNKCDDITLYTILNQIQAKYSNYLLGIYSVLVENVQLDLPCNFSCFREVRAATVEPIFPFELNRVGRSSIENSDGIVILQLNGVVRTNVNMDVESLLTASEDFFQVM